MSYRQEYNKNYKRKGSSGGRGQSNYRGSRKPKIWRLPNGTVVYVLDILEHGHIDRTRQQQQQHRYVPAKPIIQVVETPNFNLFELEYDKNAEIEMQEKIVLSRDPSFKVKAVRKRLKYHDLTQTSKELLQSTIMMHLGDQEELYLRFLNNSGPLTRKRHTLNLLPGVGEKLLWEIIRARDNRKFESFDDFQQRVGVSDIKLLIAKRILNEIIDDDSKHYLFLTRKRQQSQGQQGGQQQSRGGYNNQRGDGRTDYRRDNYRR